MNRRGFLNRTAGVLTATSLAGCSGVTDALDGEPELIPPDSVERVDNGFYWWYQNDQMLNDEQGVFVTGTLAPTDYPLGYLKIEFAFLNEKGARVATNSDSTTRLRVGQQWRYRVYSPAPADTAASYESIGVWGRRW